jgi:adenylate kinase family enzyme
MLEIGESSKNYIPSATLSTMIKDYNIAAENLVPFLKQKTEVFELNSEKEQEMVFKDVCRLVEPTVVHVRSGLESNDLRDEIVNSLVEQEGYKRLDVTCLIEDEGRRSTPTGLSLLEHEWVSVDKTTEMLRHIVYSGNKAGDRFVLTHFPEDIEQARFFE